jgi:hypothetical protein
MFRQILSLCTAAAMVLGIAASAQAYSGRTTNNTYKTGTQAALHTGAFYMTQAVKSNNPKAKAFTASDMKVIKMGKTPSSTVTSTWKLVTKQLTPMGYPLAQVTVKVKKLNDNAWKGYSAGKNAVSFLK